MRSSPLLFALALPLLSSAIRLPFSIDWLYPATALGLSSDVVPHKIAVIGAGAGGTSAAFWIAKAKARTGLAVEVDVFERSDYVGGRSTTVFPYNDSSLDPIELGGSIFVRANKNLWRASEEFNLTRLSLDDDDDESVGFWDGKEFVFIMNQSKGWFGWFDTVKAIWRYGYRSPTKTKTLVATMIDKFVSLYSPESPKWSNISTLTSELGWEDLLAQTSAEKLDLAGVSRLFSREVVEAATRVNYGQNLDEIHALEGFVSMAANRASAIKGGNFLIYQHFLARSGAKLHLNTSVTSITETSKGHWALQTSDSEEPKVYNDVILAAPYHTSDIHIESAVPIAQIPPQPYVHLHVTLITTSAPHANPEYFGLKPGAKVPTTVLTTYEGARAGGPEPEFNSMSYHGPVAPGRPEQVIKFFSKERLSDKWLNYMFDGKVEWVLRKEWDAYPKLPPTTTFPPVVLAKGLYYVNAFEPFISTMETETISSRNIVDLIFRDRFGAGICGKLLTNPESEVPQGDGEQKAFDNRPLQQSEHTPSDKDFVLGWDC